MARPVFPLRFRKGYIRELVRDVAEREGISQNELLEQAAEHEVVARGALLADELEASAARLRATTSLAGAVTASMDEFAAGEALAEPLRPRLIGRPEAARRPSRASATLGAVAAFERS